MIKNILFDFDGVILNSMKIKGDGFVELLQEYPKNSVQMLETYHYANGGVSRFEKIRYFFHVILQRKTSEQKIQSLAVQFGEIIAEKLFDPANLIAETVTFIKNNYTHYHCHIVSGAEDHELKELCSHLAITQYFKSIHGSPTIKSTLITDLLENNHYRPENTILIGDSINDYEAAKVTGVHFYGYNNEKLRLLGNYIETFSGFQP
ncbi:MAG TPA: HAD hydrolase-like protein [Sulfuricurvum sp.]|nr:MAG: hypothetical protein B7Y30_10340 [Campylobacterales bacterium 16-40-21]OZA02298.1 MAG: hypothetical protein B7X89_09740 [Sulfuricurvum sp. 17-40-25]HQS67292.1 HAD hydrolase-like protein [Sulfuricurvum sp.]HQT37247.1 HAD hydrolase-like protein [Sulfuricurvum sp.]